ncbi:MAG TPA: DinB family protein [Pyrinomonadaceae bacterium]|nr:DinB family protein [Pyrinomonadaceae bacterium]
MNDIGQEFISRSRYHLIEDFLPKIGRCLERLTDEQIWWRPNEQSNSIGNLLLHLSGNARQWIVGGVGGATDARDRDAEFAQRERIARHDLHSLLQRTLADVDQTLAQLDANQLIERRTIQGSDVSVLSAILHVVEHFSMHTGQILMMTKMLTNADLAFYEFDDSKAVPTWKTQSAHSE